MTRHFASCLLLLLTLGVCATGASGDGATDRPLVVVLLPGTSLADWRSADAPTLHRLLATGAVAVMNTRTARLPNDHRRETPESAVLTLGAGSRAAGGSEITAFHPAWGPSATGQATYGELSMRRTGSPVSPSGLVNAEWPRVSRENTSLGYDLLPGDLGSALRSHGIPTMTGGGRFAPALAADRDGTVDADVGARFPHPLPRFLVWDAGADLGGADAAIRSIASGVAARQGRMIIVSPFVDDARFGRGERLAPVVVWGAGVPPGLLYSPSTHRAGLIANTDLAPSVTAFFGELPRQPWLSAAPFGRAWMFIPRAGALAQATVVEQDAYRQADGMHMLPLVAVCLGLLTIVSVLRVRRGLSSGGLCLLPGVIVFALLVSPTPGAAALWAVAVSLLCLLLATRLPPARLALSLAGVTVLALVVDMLTGDRLMQRTLLGYSAVEGARYYGVGNEAMGPLVGSGLVLGGLGWKPLRPHLVLLAGGYAGLSLLLGLPTAGAKAGGLLVALAAFGTFLWAARGGRMNARLSLGFLAMMLLTLGIVALFDWHHGTGAQTHLGAAVGRIATGGVGEAWDIVRRKLSVEGRLLYHSAWAIPLWASILALADYRKRISREKEAGHRALFSGGVAAVAACLALNDAGVVAGALCGVLTLTALAAGEEPKEENSRPAGLLPGGGDTNSDSTDPL